MLRRIAIVMVLLAIAAGCSRGGGPRIKPYTPPTTTEQTQTQQGSTTVSQPAVSRVAQVQSGNIHTVRRGETLYAISRAYQVPLRSLIQRNSLAPPYTLETGQELIIPKATIHTVKSGDTVYAISRQYGVAMNDLVRTNGIEPPFTIKVGQQLAIPARVVEARPQIVTESLPEPVVDEVSEVASLPQPVARPAEDPVSADPDAPRAPKKPQPAQAVEPPPPPEPFQVTQDGFPRPVLRPEDEPNRPLLATSGAIPKPAPRARSKFLWPVQGRVIARFGPIGQGLHNDGINVAAPRGSPVRAAENGVVVYSGSELKGFGSMVLLKHADGYMTAYAHNEDLLVTRGQTVRRGQTIARVGSTGDVDRPQLHFELRKGRKAINPISRLEG